MEALANEPGESLDCVVSFDLLGHFSRNGLLALVDGVHRVLSSGGRWVIHAPNAV